MEIVDFFSIHSKKKAVAVHQLHSLSNTNEKAELWLQISVGDTGREMQTRLQRKKNKNLCSTSAAGASPRI